MNKKLSQAIADIRAGRQRKARGRLRAVLQQNPTKKETEITWLCLAQLVTAPAKKRVCYQKVIALNPENKYAQQGLQRLGVLAQEDIHAETKSPSHASNSSHSESIDCSDGRESTVRSVNMAKPVSTPTSQITSPSPKAKLTTVENATVTSTSHDSEEGGLAIESVILLPVFGAIAGATLGAGEIILLAIDILINSGEYWLLNLVLILLGATIGAPIVILVGIILAIIGGIGGFIGSVAIAIVCLVIYGLLSLTAPTRKLRGAIIFIVTVAGFTILTEYGLNQQVVNSFLPLEISELPLMNNIVGFIVGIFVGASLFTVSDISLEEEEGSQVSQKKGIDEDSVNVVGGIWRGYRKLGKGLLDMHEDYLEDKRRETEINKWSR